MRALSESEPAAPAETAAVLAVAGLSKTYGSGPTATEAVANLEFSVTDKEFVSLVGPSGCGKTTLLKCMSGLLRPSGGRTLFRGEPVVDPPAGLAVVFQDYSRSLLPWMTVRRNVQLPLTRRGEIEDREAAVAESLKAVGLAAFEDHYPWQLSGGMQQRVAIARALACRPQVLLMDEPFASVDAQTRAELEDLVLRVRADFGVTVVLVTHDIDEAVYMSDRIVVLSRQPSRVREILTVDLPRPRDQVKTKALPAFAEIRGHLYQAVTGAARSYEPSSIGEGDHA